MRKYISWNNRRRNIAYWLSIELLLLLGFGILAWETWNLDIFDKLFREINPFASHQQLPHALCDLALWHICILVTIALINRIVGFLPDKALWKHQNLSRFLSNSAFGGDVVLGIVLESMALIGLYGFHEYYRSTSLALWMYYAFFVVGSILYWDSIIPLIQYRRVKTQLVNPEGYEAIAWYALTNSAGQLSTFERVCWKGRINQVILDAHDLNWINLLRTKDLCISNFIYYCILVDPSMPISKDFENQVKFVTNLPHSKVILLLAEDNSLYSPSMSIINAVSNCPNVIVRKLTGYSDLREINIEEILLDSGLRSQKYVRLPLKYITDNRLVETYLNIGKSPLISLNFMKKILNELDAVSGIYALFDYIDLLYRMSIAYVQPWRKGSGDDPDSAITEHETVAVMPPSFGNEDPCIVWLKKHGHKIGNLSKMGDYIENDAIYKDITWEVFNSAFVINEERIIQKYLPNLCIDYKRTVADAIVHLTTNLRNVIRGHGYFDLADAETLFKLVFKLALLNAHILSLTNLDLRIQDTVVWSGETNLYMVSGKIHKGEYVCLSPFLVATESGSILVFNNWSENTIEYINYLDGTIILPSVLSIDTVSTRK